MSERNTHNRKLRFGKVSQKAGGEVGEKSRKKEARRVFGENAEASAMFQMDDAAVPQTLFEKILGLIAGLRLLSHPT